MAMRKMVYFFGNGKSEGSKESRVLLGGKGLGLAQMTDTKVSVPAGFTITTEVCNYYNKNKSHPKGLEKEVLQNVKKLESAMGMKFGDPKNPLLVSVRSGAAVSMPGMMDTILNLGINDDVVKGIIEKTGNERFAWDAYRRFIQMFSDVAMGVDIENFEHILEAAKAELALKMGKHIRDVRDTDLSVEELKDIVAKYKAKYKEVKGEDFITDPIRQMWHSIEAVFRSWNNPRAIEYRRLNEIKDLWGTAVNLQAMVFGNMGDNSATGVCFSRNPATGEKKFYGEFLINAQGEDLVAGIRTPQEITLEGSLKWAEENNISEEERKRLHPSLEEVMPKAYDQLVKYKDQLEKYYRDMQDMEFTIQEGKLYMLQTRNGKRTAHAAVKIAVDLVAEKRITKEEALLRINPNDLDQLLHPTFDAASKSAAKVIAKGKNASPGAAVGKAVFSADKAVEMKKNGEDVVLIRIETSPEDIMGMHSASGILTARGGATSHAAVVARGMGKCCVVGCSVLDIDYNARTMKVGEVTVNEGDCISLDGSTGEVMYGCVSTKEAEFNDDFKTIMDWSDSIARLEVHANADTPHDAMVARKFGATGIGLCRSEHMFFEGDRIKKVRELILVADEYKRLEQDLENAKRSDAGTSEIASIEKNIAEPKRLYYGALEAISVMQKEDFVGIFEVMSGYPVTIRLLDPPLHEFLPQEDSLLEGLARDMNLTFEKVKSIRDGLHEFNPMLGLRGCRLGIVYPEISDMQASAIISAAIAAKKNGATPIVEIMVPLIGSAKELSIFKDRIKTIIERELTLANVKIEYRIGTMIEVPRAAITADEIGVVADFFSFGTNDLTQFTCGLSRDDSTKFLSQYIKADIFERDPFQTLDASGVGRLMKTACELARPVNKKLKLGICGEHGGDPSSVIFCNSIGLNYVSCSPFRVPIARLAAAQGVIMEKNKSTKSPSKKSNSKKTIVKKSAAKKPLTKNASVKKKVVVKKTVVKKSSSKKVAKKK